MDEFIISEDIYEDSLNRKDYRISDDIYDDAMNLSEECIRQELVSSVKFSGRYWVWKLGSAVYEYRWKRMLAENEMQMPAKGFKYFLSYPDVTSLQMAYFEKNGVKGFGSSHNIGKGLDLTKSVAYYDFSRSLRIWDVVLVVAAKSMVVAWGQVRSDYMYRPTRAYGRHYRRVSWNRISMPFELTDKKEYLYQLPDGDTVNLKEKLISQQRLDKNSLPFGFVGGSVELSIPFEAEIVPPSYSIVHTVDSEKERNVMLGNIIGSLLRVIQ